MIHLTFVIALFGCALAGVIDPRSSEQVGGRIVGGEQTTIEKYPYQVSLQKGGSHFCGGSLYSEDIVITAAHCLQSSRPDQISIRLGSSDYNSGGELIQVKAFKFHSGYEKTLKMHDVAVVKLMTPVRFTNKIQPIELAESVPATGSQGVVTGWGHTKFLIGSVQDILRLIEVDIVAKKDCESDKFKYGSSKILDTMVCAAAEEGGKDACQGDSGGPLASGGKLVGVVSWGNMCARKDYPGVYASVPELREWIIKEAKIN